MASTACAGWSRTVAGIGIGKARAIEAFLQAHADPLHGYMCATQE
ncbi:phage integrase family protein [Cupriavidus basilensis]